MRIIKTRTERGRPGTEARRECVCTCTEMCDSGQGLEPRLGESVCVHVLTCVTVV